MLAQLAAKSLIQIERHDGETRYTMLETLRQYGAERVRQASADGAAQLHAAHARAVARWAEHAGQFLQTTFTRELIMRVDWNFPNVHAVLGREFGSGGNSEAAIAVVALLQRYWYASLRNADLQHWLTLAEKAATPATPPIERASLVIIRCGTREIPHPEELDQLIRAETLFEQAGDDAGAANARGFIAYRRMWQQGMDSTCIDDVGGAIKRLRQAGDLTGERALLFVHCAVTAALGNLNEASALIKTTSAQCRAAGDDFHLNRLLLLQAHIQMENHAFARALALVQEVERVAHSFPDPVYELRARIFVAENLHYLGDPAQSALKAAECMTYAQNYQGDVNEEAAILALVKSLIDLGRFDEAHAHMHGLLTQRFHTKGATDGLYLGHFDAMALNASAAGRAAEAAYLFGAADSDVERSKRRRFRRNDIENAPMIRRAKDRLGEAAYERQYAAGKAATLEQAIQFALTFW